MRLALPLVAATLVITGGTGCGANDAQSPGTSTSPASTAQSTRPKPPAHQSRWARQVDVACKPWQKRIDAVTPAPVDTISLKKWLGRALPLVRKQIAAVEAVKPPADEGEARKVSVFLGALQKTERSLTDYLAAISANASANVQQKALADASRTGSTARAYAQSLNITQCGGYSSG
jgi:hypothetical protein